MCVCDDGGEEFMYDRACTRRSVTHSIYFAIYTCLSLESVNLVPIETYLCRLGEKKRKKERNVYFHCTYLKNIQRKITYTGQI
jgi:hypothetical protein